MAEKKNNKKGGRDPETCLVIQCIREIIPHREISAFFLCARFHLATRLRSGVFTFISYLSDFFSRNFVCFENLWQPDNRHAHTHTHIKRVHEFRCLSCTLHCVSLASISSSNIFDVILNIIENTKEKERKPMCSRSYG